MKRVRVRLADELADKAEGILKEMGLTHSEAMTLFYQQIVQSDGLPFAVELPRRLNGETIAAIEEDLSCSKAYSSSDECWKDLGI